jgi:predicted dinucleotide-binding enzyme
LLAVHWSRIDDVLKQAGDLSGKVIVTCCLPMDSGDDAGFDAVDVGPLRIARYTEPFALLVGEIAYNGQGGPGNHVPLRALQ